jgi:hypothetical protein
LEINKGIDTLDPASPAIFHLTHALKVPLLHCLPEIGPIHQLVVTLSGEELEKRVGELSAIGPRLGNDRNPRTSTQTEFRWLRRIDSDRRAGNK